MTEPITIGWDEWLASRAKNRENLKRRGLDAPSRRKTSYNTSERFMRASFGGGRIPEWADGKEVEEP